MRQPPRRVPQSGATQPTISIQLTTTVAISSAITRSRGQDLAAARLVVNLVQSRALSVNLGRTWLPHGSSSPSAP